MLQNNQTDRRTSVYSFCSQKDLVAFFSNLLPKERISEVLKNAKANFVKRAGTSAQETRLQFLKKCEIQLRKIIKEAL